MRILVDLDGIAADFLGQLLKDYNRITGENVHAEDIRGWAMGNYVDDPALMTAIFHKEGWFEALPTIPGAIRALNRLHDKGHDIVIVSTPCTPHSAAEKIRWCKREIPWLNQTNVFIGHHKYMVVGDALIDDGLHNVLAYKKHHPKALTLGIAYAYNDDQGLAEPAFDLRANCYEYPETAWDDIYWRLTQGQ